MTTKGDKKAATEGDAAPAAGGEEGLIQARRTKASAVRDRGQNPFTNDVSAAGRSLVIAGWILERDA